jgi:hypothetical protein
MERPPFDIADLVRWHRPGLEAIQALDSEQGRALTAMTLCRTAALGGHEGLCLACGLKEDPSYNSCRNRNCPKCQALAQERWIATRAAAILPVPHFHGVFTLPEDFRPLARRHPRAIYDAMFRCASSALLKLARARLGTTLGLTLVLHTWTRELHFHPHIHALISAGGLSLDGAQFKRIKATFLLHVRALAALFKKKMMKTLRRLQDEGTLQLGKDAFGTLMVSLAGQRWNMYVKKAFKSAAFVLKYLGRYTHRIGISNSRLVSVGPEEVTFRTKCGRSITLHPVAFLQRLVQHVLPAGFKKIRHMGLYAAPKALALAKGHLGTALEPAPPTPTWQEALLALTGVDATRCKGCGAELYHTALLPDRPWPRRFRDPMPRSPP